MSATLTLNLDTLTQEGADLVLGILALKGFHGAPVPASTIPIETPEEREALDAIETASAPKKRGRPKKENPTPAPASVEPPAMDAEPSTPDSAPAPTAAKPILDDLRNALMALTAKSGMAAGLELLQEFGCQRVTEIMNLPVDQQLNFMARANA